MDTLINQCLLSQRLSAASIAKVVGLLLSFMIAGTCWTYRNRGLWSSSPRNSKVIPNLKGKPFVGSAHELQTQGAASCKAWYRLYQRYGPAYEMTVPFFRLHVINHPIYLEHIQKHNSKNYVRGAFTRNMFATLHRTGIFVADGQEWQVQRKAATRAFSKKNFETHITRSLHYWLGVLTRLLSNLAKDGVQIDFQALMGRLMFCLFLRIAFHEDELARDILSEDPKCLDSIPPYVEAFDRATHLFDRRRRDPLWRITERLSGEDKSMQRAVDLFYAQIDALIAKRFDLIKDGYKPDPEAGVDLLDMFIQSTDDQYRLGGMVFAFLSAGRDTTAYTISWLMKEILHSENRHLNAVEKIRDEAEQFGLDNTFLTYEDAPKLRFANAMWDETARLDTVSPAGQMEAAGDDILPAIPELNMPTRHVKKGDIVSYQNYVLSRMPEVWGDDATVFNPLRWFKETGENISYSPFKYHSWNAGPRSCLGRALATYEGLAISTAILQRFDVSLVDEKRTYEPLAALNMGIKGGLLVTITER
ncbi:hypothetical protein E8E14_012170 [Neopestalotiopsis sp. 37M]|nr:hypothetical protein E8E14_012170 [Neopestalotiopsis sp. 37M]